MKTKLLIFFLATMTAISETNYVVYVLSTGAKVSYDRQYEIDAYRISVDGVSFKPASDPNLICGILSTTNDPSKIVNISELKSKTILVPGDFLKQTQAAKEITPAVQAFMDCYNKKNPTNQITAAELTTATTNRIKEASVKAVQE